MPYEISKKYEEEIIGEFENSIEERYFHKFISILNRESVILNLACGDGRHTLKLFLSSIYNVLKLGRILYMSVETWMYSNLVDTLREFLWDLKLFLYWKFIRRKPLIWREYLYGISIENVSIPHYHVHIDKWTLCKILDKNGFMVKEIDLYDGYIYVLCRKT